MCLSRGRFANSVNQTFSRLRTPKTEAFWRRQYCVRVALWLFCNLPIIFCFAACDDGGKALSQPVRRATTHNVPESHQSTAAPGADIADNPKQNPAATAAATQPEAIREDLQKYFSLIKARRTGPARIQLVKHLKLRPDDGQATFLFGLTYHREQRYGQATPYYEQALRLAPDFPLIHYFHGWALYYLGDLEAARRSFDLFEQTHPDEADMHFAVGLIELDEDNLDEAEARFRKSIELLRAKGGSADPKDMSKALTRLGEVHERRGELDKAQTELTLAVQLYPDHYEALYKLYRVLVRLGETEHAQRIHKQYLETKERVRPGTSFPE